MLIAVAATGLAALAWLYLLAGHGGFWRSGPPLPAGEPPDAAAGWSAVTAVVPARDEAAMLPLSLPTLLAQDYPGPLRVVLVDDDSTDGTAQAAAALRRPGQAALEIVTATPAPAGWAGKVWAMAEGAAAAGEPEYLLFTDADIGYDPGVLTGLVRAARLLRASLVSQMALLRAGSAAERLLVPAFVYFFAQLYPFRRVSRPGGRTAAAAGGCMLVRRDALAAAGGLAAIAGARIDDVALGRLLKRGPAPGRCFLGLTTRVRSLRSYPRLADVWDMVARSAYTQLHYSPAALAGTVAGLAWLYLLPPAAALAGAGLALAGAGPGAGGGPSAAWLAGLGAAGRALMSVTFAPMLRRYRLSALRAPLLPVIAALYAAMTVDSARRHRSGRGAEWKGRAITSSLRGRPVRRP
ncbi:MAG: glycosyltransferase [Actinobacteria bacterium]|nr:glycosyltransferase [Actinomycetota bacterium]